MTCLDCDPWRLDPAQAGLPDADREQVKGCVVKGGLPKNRSSVLQQLACFLCVFFFAHLSFNLELCLLLITEKFHFLIIFSSFFWIGVWVLQSSPSSQGISLKR